MSGWLVVALVGPGIGLLAAVLVRRRRLHRQARMEALRQRWLHADDPWLDVPRHDL